MVFETKKDYYNNENDTFLVIFTRCTLTTVAVPSELIKLMGDWLYFLCEGATLRYFQLLRY